MNSKINKAVDVYIDDIFVDESIVPVEKVKDHLLKYGLVSKDPEKFQQETSVRVLGLEVFRDNYGTLRWRRANRLQLDLDEVKTRRDLYSFCGQITGINPVCGWLRVATSFLKRQSTGDWDSPIREELKKAMGDVVEKIKANDCASGT